MKVIKGLVWFLWLLFMLFIIYATLDLSYYWMIAFFLWFVPAHFIMEWLKAGAFEEINSK
jgi:hypothetical protein